MKIRFKDFFIQEAKTLMTNKILKKGDKVGSRWGEAKIKNIAVRFITMGHVIEHDVDQIETMYLQGDKNVPDARVMFDLDNGHWVWGDQITIL